jgi:hypothetical protein
LSDPGRATVSRNARLLRNLLENLFTERSTQFAREIRIAASQANLQPVDIDVPGLVLTHDSIPSSSDE